MSATKQQQQQQQKYVNTGLEIITESFSGEFSELNFGGGQINICK